MSLTRLQRAFSALTNSVFVKCAAVMAISSLLLLVELSWQAYRMAERIETANVADLGLLTAEAEAIDVTDAVRFNANAKIDEALAKVQASLKETVVAGMVQNTEGEILSQFGANGSDELLLLAAQSLSGSAAVRSVDGLVTAMPIRKTPEDAVIGVLVIEMSVAERVARLRDDVLMTGLTALGFLVVSVGCTILVLRRILGRPLASVTHSIRDISVGHYDSDVPMRDRKDAFGDIARDLSELSEQLGKAETAKAEQLEDQQVQAQVVDLLTDALTCLSQGMLTRSLEDGFPEEYHSLRNTYNAALSSLHNAIEEVQQNALSINDGSDEIAHSADDLSHRTETQAATLEQTAAALEQLVASVASASESTQAVDRRVKNATEMALQNEAVMQSAVAAMEQIEKSSDQIGEIISVIDDIAFQTNLLALNAGVEAARAGSSGKGFAVVASEVRALAQRSSDAAGQIKTLIDDSGARVKEGALLVSKAGSDLNAVVERIHEISELVSGIASGTKEQAEGIREINEGVAHLDQVTQQNAAMVENTTAAAHTLRSDAGNLSSLVQRFHLRSSGQKTGGSAQSAA